MSARADQIKIARHKAGSLEKQGMLSVLDQTEVSSLNGRVFIHTYHGYVIYHRLTNNDTISRDNYNIPSDISHLLIGSSRAQNRNGSWREGLSWN